MTRNEVCSKCDSSSQSMCLLIRHCPLWVDKPNMTEEEIRGYKQEWIKEALAKCEVE